MKEENKSIKEALEKLQKKYGKDVVMQMDKDVDFKVDWISTGCFGLDELIGHGIPRGRVIEIFGSESGGKTTIALFLIAQIQKNGGIAAFIDAENAFDGEYAKNIGVDVSKLLISQPDTLESSMDIIKELVETSSIDIIVVDSVSALVPKSETEGKDFMKDSMAVQARLMSRALRVLSGPISKSKTIVIFINQIRDRVGVFFGSKTTTSGGRALKFFSSVRLEISKGAKIEGRDEIQIGNQIIVTAVKNKVGFPWKKITLDLYYAKGIDLVSDAVSFGEKIGVISKTGNTYTFGETKLGVSRDKAKDFLVGNEEIYQKIREEINKQIKI